MEAEREGDGGFVGEMSGRIDLGLRDPSAAVDLTGSVHLLPCVVRQNGACPISQYFKPRKSDLVIDGLVVKEAFFRGRRLQGFTVPIPEGYHGYVLEKKKIGGGQCVDAGIGEANRWVSRAEFQNITYWNAENLPSKQDPILRSFHWFAISDALNKNITKEEMASVSTYGECHEKK
ncbi:hypothetical protein AXF42_Ash012231 [Apostasia shenzhenica]|uniref:Uncharacterized protein n=1 Tax=Apostasia shenzhenica TaxID=1088818 RepID=A0A2I0B4D4_9ASPA|nr:hypothetical protein AXF42_Ash012231 [Apostasia shenzhenica]